ncbi:MAG: ATPase [Chloroflexi bacterium]|nr:ATPase [Chloroflexota bacterium]
MTDEEQAIRNAITDGKTFLGIELGSTRIKSVLIDENHATIASGGYSWENRLENGIWTYDLEDAWTGLRASYQDLNRSIRARYDLELEKVSAIGISGMMVGYLVFDRDDRQLVPFRTWRNTITEEASHRLTDLFKFNIPQRWSIAHLYQAMLNGESHVKDIAFLTTLAGYIHWQLTGKKVVALGDASGILPINQQTCDYDARMVELFNELLPDFGISWKLRDILPQACVAGADAGVLTEAGAQLLDSSGKLQPGIPLCPPEGDGITGMVATNSVAPGTGNISAGTSIFTLIILEKMIENVHPDIEFLATPEGRPAAMVHASTCTSDLDAWVGLFREFKDLLGADVDDSRLYELLYNTGLEGDADAGGMLAYNYLAGEHLTRFEEGRPLFARHPNSRFTLANFMRSHLYAALATFRIGLDYLLTQEGVKITRVLGHGGFFKTEGVGQRIIAAVMNAPVSVMETAGEGGAWGIAVLAAYLRQRNEVESFEDFLSERVFADFSGKTVTPDPADVRGFQTFMERYRAGLPIMRAAVDNLKPN